MAARKPAKKAAKRTVRKAEKRTVRKAAKRTVRKAAKRTVRKAAKPAKAGKSAAPKKAAKRAASVRRPDGSRRDKGEGKEAHAAAIAKLPVPHRAMAERFDEIVTREAPDALRAVKWGSPMWGSRGRGWFAAFGSFKDYAKINFFSGARLEPVPPEGEGKDMRSINLASMGDVDEKQLASWVRQAAAIQGWGKA